METGAIVVSVVVGLFGVASAILGFTAEATKLTPDDIHVSRRECVYPANPAFKLALCALILLVVAQIVATAAGACCGCRRPRTDASSATKRTVGIGIAVSVLSWAAALIAGAFYLRGAEWNAPTTRDTANGRCYFLKGRVFMKAALLSLVATELAIKSYILLTWAPAPTTAAEGTVPKPDGQYPPAAEGQPQRSAQGYGQAPYTHHAGGFGQTPNPQRHTHAQV